MITSAEIASSLRVVCEISNLCAVRVVQAPVIEVQVLLHVELHFWVKVGAETEFLSIKHVMSKSVECAMIKRSVEEV